MGKKKSNAEYNEFLDGEKLKDNAEPRISLQDVCPPPISRKWKGHSKGKGKGKGPKKPPLTHFLCLPLVNEWSETQLRESLERFKRDLSGDVGNGGSGGLVPLKAVRPVGTLHLTLGVMSLNDEGVEGVGQFLQDLDLRELLQQAGYSKSAKESLGSEAENGARKKEGGTTGESVESKDAGGVKELRIALKGLHPMQQAHKTSILFASPYDQTNRLLPFSQVLRSLFTEKGFLVPDERKLKLHATIVNTIYAKPGGRGGRGKREKAKAAGKERKAGNEQDEHQEQQDEAEAASNPDHCEQNTVPDPTTGEIEAPDKERSEGHGPNANSWLRFDATELIDRYREFVLAENIRIDRVQVCKMGAKKILDEQGDVVGEAYEAVFDKMI
ncbi:hypothetical protein K469DRAFT_577254 [Zopfia rhizophila CBS 207.26]|uniref:A-kinase anchor protein 7-like phosphoesterase domain-containing protein n=1 Tax=Zopfia rhizophila CBS 207.26 TaxID=1314779 RepID=A0A6A6E213_9PEZI|nr:hypothetical protein K469DRAFT_577254 [Zopfia rhizophila CBS 207.26]